MLADGLAEIPSTEDQPCSLVDIGEEVVKICPGEGTTTFIDTN
jgi:hypothetical protein